MGERCVLFYPVPEPAAYVGGVREEASERAQRVSEIVTEHSQRDLTPENSLYLDEHVTARL